MLSVLEIKFVIFNEIDLRVPVNNRVMQSEIFFHYPRPFLSELLFPSPIFSARQHMDLESAQGKYFQKFKRDESFADNKNFFCLARRATAEGLRRVHRLFNSVHVFNISHHQWFNRSC